MSLMVKSTMAEVDTKSGPAGTARAIFSTFGVVDHDGDVVLPTAIADGTETILGHYNHNSVIGAALPIGKAIIHTDHEKAWADLEFNMELQSARDTWSAIKQLGHLQEYSYSFKVLDADHGPAPDGSGRQVQFLKALDIFEVSPVIRGASLNTGTVPGSVKEQVIAEAQAILAQLDPVQQVKEIRAQYLGFRSATELETHAQALAMAEEIRFIRAGLAA
jgi:hypothetical protein